VKVSADKASLDEGRLERVVEHLRTSYIQSGLLPGCQVAVSRGGQVGLFGSLGMMDVERHRPVEETTIWRIFSMTKPVTAVAVLTLYERGQLQLDDEVSRFLPELDGLKVRERGADGKERLVDPERPVTVWDLLTHMGGFGFPSVRGAKTWALVNRRPAPGFLWSYLHRGATLGTLVGELAEQPLEFHPGTRWFYTVCTDVCARIVEVLTGKPFDVYLQEAVFGPLGMVDTGFRVPGEKLSCLGTLYRRDAGGSLTVQDDPEHSPFREEPTFLSGGSGLLSTTADYIRFSDALANGGTSGGVRLLGRKTVDLMGSNHLPAGGDLRSVALPGSYGEIDVDGMGFGLSVAVGIDPARMRSVGSVGEMTWAGAASTVFWADPSEALSVVFMAQVSPSVGNRVRRELRALVYAALAD
jgi:CubicO group peptidase (beta-lactamase class C family)